MCCEAKAYRSGREKVRVELGKFVREEAVGQLVGFCCSGGVAGEEGERQRTV